MIIVMMMMMMKNHESLTCSNCRPVKVVRLLARDTVEEIMYSRAVSKLHLTNTVIEEGRFSLLDQAQSAAAGMQVSEPKKITKSSSTACQNVVKMLSKCL